MIKRLLGIRFHSLLTAFSGKRSKNGAPQKPSAGKIVLFAILYLYLGVCFMVLFGGLFAGCAAIFFTMGHEWAYFAFFAVLSFAITFIGSVFMTKAQIFEAKDTELLLSMPIRPGDIVASRMVFLIIVNYLIELTVAAPCALFWAIMGQPTVLSWIFLGIITLLLPLFSLAFSGIFAFLISKIAAKIKNKSIVTVVLSLAFFALYFYFIGNTENAIGYVTENSESIADGMQKIWPIYALGATVSEGNILYLLASVAMLFLPFLLMWWVVEKSFFKIALSPTVAGKTRGRVAVSDKTDAKSALLRREFQHLVSSPTYMLNCGLSVPLAPVAAVVGIIKKADLIGIFETLWEVLPFPWHLAPADLLAAIFTFGLCLLGGMGLFTSSSVSLEGKNLSLLHGLPVESKEFLMAKLKMHLYLMTSVMAISSVILAIVFRPSLPMLLILLTVPPLFSVWGANVGLVANLNHPMLDWINETQPVKQGMAVLFGMLFTFLMTVLLVAVTGVLGWFVNLWLAAVADLLILGTAIFLSYKWLMTSGVKKWRTLG